MNWEIIGVWVGAFLTLAIFSFLYRDNIVYKAAEHLFVGVSAGYWVARLYHDSVLPDLIYPVFKPQQLNMESANYWPLIPGVLGLMMLARFVTPVAWMSRWPIAFVVGVGTGSGVPRTIQAALLTQLGATLVPIVVHKSAELGGGVDWFTSIGNIILIAGVGCTLAYFYFSRAHEGGFGVLSRIGIWYLMIAFGSGFGYTVMARESLLIGRIIFLIDQWIRPTLAAFTGG